MFNISSQTGVSGDAFILKIPWTTRQPDSATSYLTRRAPAADFACLTPPWLVSWQWPDTRCVCVRSFDQGSRRQKKPDADLHGDMPLCKRIGDAVTNWVMVARPKKETRRGTFAAEFCTSRGKSRKTEKLSLQWVGPTCVQWLWGEERLHCAADVFSGKNVLVCLSVFYFLLRNKDDRWPHCLN